MGKKLKIGGIYSTGNPDLYYVFLGVLPSEDYALFIKVKTNSNKNIDIVNELKSMLNDLSITELHQYFIEFDKDNFINNYSGFVGSVEDWMVARLLR